MGASRSRQKYAARAEAVQEHGEGGADTVSSQYVTSQRKSPSEAVAAAHNGADLTSVQNARRSSSVVDTQRYKSRFPQVHTAPTTTHAEVRPHWAVPKFSQWFSHAQEQRNRAGDFRAEQSLGGALRFAKRHARRYALDRLLSPRTLFREVYDKSPGMVTEEECFLIDTFVAERQRIWRVEDKAANRLQCYWRQCKARAVLGAKYNERQLQTELDMADRRRVHDMTISARLVREGRISMEAEAARIRAERERSAESVITKRQESSWIAGFVAAGGVKTLTTGDFSSKGAQRLRAKASLPKEFVSDRRYTLLCHVLGRLAEAGEMRWAWQGVRIREAFRTWHIGEFHFSHHGYHPCSILNWTSENKGDWTA